MLINFEYKGRPAYAFTVYNFNQVCDGVLLVMADKKREKVTVLFTHFNGHWETSDDVSFLSPDSLKKINDRLIGLFKTSVAGDSFNLSVKGHEATQYI